MVYIKKDILASSTYSFITGKSVSKENEPIKESISDFGAFEEEMGMNEMICNKIQISISLCKEDLETVTEKNDLFCSSKINSYYWLSFYRLKTIISMNPYDHLESGKTKIEKNTIFLIDKKKCLREHDYSHKMI